MAANSGMPMDMGNLGARQTADDYPALADRLASTDAFPFPSYREHQQDSLETAREALYGDNDIEVVVLDLPTGIGKSGINTALCRMAMNAFMTTPQRSLREQLGDDPDLNDHYSVLKGRPDYACTPGSMRAETDGDVNCSECPINRGDESCKDYGCSYWNAKEDAMAADTAVLTFAYLVIDSYVPTENPETGQQISFGDRELGVIDEAHKLADQTASLFAGFTISPWTLPPAVFRPEMDEQLNEDWTRFEDVLDVMNTLYDRAESFIIKNQQSMDPEMQQHVEDCEEFRRKMGWLREERRDGRPWVVNIEKAAVNGRKADRKRPRIELKPIDVDKFLQQHVWSRADKWVLSTATMPYRDSPAEWLDELGLPTDPSKFKVISKPMPFDVANRPIITDEAIAKMSSGGFGRNTETIIRKLRTLADRHDGQNGLVHVSSYKQADLLADALGSLAIAHDQQGADPQQQLETWQQRPESIFISPSCQEGVDLEGDMCRWQALVKVPYPNAGDSRWDYLLNERKAWGKYFEGTALDVVQSAGRGVRSTDDWCVYYVLDTSFSDLQSKVSYPDWFEQAIDPDGPTVADDYQ